MSFELLSPSKFEHPDIQELIRDRDAVIMNINHEGFDRRLVAVQRILRQFALESTKVSPIAYVEGSPFPFNNFIYKVELLNPATPSTFPAQPCTAQPPSEGVSTLIVRMSNPHADGLNNANRVQNDVAAQYLVRQSLASTGIDPVVPAVYAWAACKYPEEPGEAGFGWTICEFKPGSDLDAQFASLTPGGANDVVEQLASIFSAVQLTKLPDTVTKFGALTIDDSGAIVAGQSPLLKGGPWGSYADYWIAKFQAQLSGADGSSVLRGWVDRGVREQIDKALESGSVHKLLDRVDIT